MSGTNRGLFPQLLKRPFDTAATHTNEFSNSISDLPSRDHVGASVGASAAAGLWIKKMKTFFFSCSAPSEYQARLPEFQSKDHAEQTQRKNRDFLNHRSVPAWAGWLGSGICHIH